MRLKAALNRDVAAVVTPAANQKPSRAAVVRQVQVPDRQPDDAEAYEERNRREMREQFARLKQEAQALFGTVRGQPGARTPEQWARMLEEAGDRLGNGRFLVQQLGAERYLDPAMVAVLITLRQNLIADLKRPATAADVMIVDGAVMAYYNMIRVQRWMGDLSLVVERELFGQAPLNEIHGEHAGARLREELHRLGEVLMPLQERAHKVMIRSLDRLR